MSSNGSLTCKQLLEVQAFIKKTCNAVSDSLSLFLYQEGACSNHRSLERPVIGERGKVSTKC